MILWQIQYNLVPMFFEYYNTLVSKTRQQYHILKNIYWISSADFIEYSSFTNINEMHNCNSFAFLKIQYYIKSSSFTAYTTIPDCSGFGSSLFFGTVFLMEDGPSAYGAKWTQQEHAWYCIPTLVWPPSSPDLNPIVATLIILKNRLDKRIPKPKGVDQMKASILEEWEDIASDEISKIVDSMLL